MIYPWAHEWHKPEAKPTPNPIACARCGGDVGTMRAAYFAPWKGELWAPLCSACLRALMEQTPCPPTLDDAGRGVRRMEDVEEDAETGALEGTGKAGEP